MSKQLIFSALIGAPSSVLLALNRFANGSWWAVMWVAVTAIHTWVIVGEIRSMEKQGRDKK